MQLRVDDYFLLFSCVCLVGATGLLYYGTPSIFFGAELTFNPTAVTEGTVNDADVLELIDSMTKIDWAYLALSWVTIFSVKFGFLSLFRHLVDRIPPMYRFWKGVVISTGLISGFVVCSSFIGCSKLESESGEKQDAL